jgi:hypothetical protein
MAAFEVWFKTSVFRVKIGTTRGTEKRRSPVGLKNRLDQALRKKDGTNKWHTMAHSGSLLGGLLVPSRFALRRSGKGAVPGRAELRSLERKPLWCQALCRLIPPVSSQPPARDRGCRIGMLLTVALTGRLCHRRAPVSRSSDRPGQRDTGCAPRTHSIPIYTVLRFQNFVNAHFTIWRKNRSKSLTSLGKKNPRNFQIASFARSTRSS